jgi:hypothetical protein
VRVLERAVDPCGCRDDLARRGRAHRRRLWSVERDHWH